MSSSTGSGFARIVPLLVHLETSWIFKAIDTVLHAGLRKATRNIPNWDRFVKRFRRLLKSGSVQSGHVRRVHCHWGPRHTKIEVLKWDLVSLQRS